MDDYIPKLVPTWHDLTLNDSNKKGHTKFRYAPNHGGRGLDLGDSDLVRVGFSANKCALPFLVLRKIHNLKDPCLEELKREKSEFDKFCMKMTYARIAAKKKCSNIKALQQQLNICMENNGNAEINIKAPKNLLHLAEKVPKRVAIPKFNVAYAGGSLAVSKCFSNLNLLHPVEGELNKLCITPLQRDTDKHFKPDCHEQLIVNLDKELILQIEPALNGFCCVRQRNSFHLVNMTNMNIFSKRVHKSSLYHVAASPYNPAEILSVYEKGTMKLINIETRKTWSISKDLYDDPSLICPTWRCSFGSHLFSTLCLNEKKVYSFDCREKKYTVKEIFNIENPSCHIGEELTAMKLWNKNPFQHFLTSTYHLIICDERYPKIPVMYMNHTLKDPPVYLECTNLDGNMSGIVIGTQDTQELAAFLFSNGTDIQPIALTSPLLMSSPTDCIESLKLHSYYVDDKFSSRLSCPLTGVCIAPNAKGNAFTVLQSTSIGDIFYQDFKQSKMTEKNYRVSTGCVLTPPEKIIPSLKEWISSNSHKDEEPEEINEIVTCLQINIDKILSPPEEISSNCSYCRLRNFSGEKELVMSEICPTCSLSSAESEHFNKAVTNTSAVIGPRSKKLSILDRDIETHIEYLKRFGDPFSRRILSVWLDSDDMSS